jgi:hypothetical protein
MVGSLPAQADLLCVDIIDQRPHPTQRLVMPPTGPVRIPADAVAPVAAHPLAVHPLVHLQLGDIIF